MKSSIFVTTTESIEEMKIEKYLDFISTNVVLGTNIFSDIGASFSDLFGGTSEIYQNKLDRIYKAAIDKLKGKAKALGANGIIGLRIDFDEISGKGKSMFMVSASGMGVKLSSLSTSSKPDLEIDWVSPEEIKVEVEKLKISEKVFKNQYPSEEELNFLLEFPIEELLENLISIYLAQFKDGIQVISTYQKALREFLPKYLRSFEAEKVSDVLYAKIPDNPIVVSTIIKETQSFNPTKVLELLNHNKTHYAVLTLDSSKRGFQKSDLKIMTSILENINNLPDTGKIEPVKSILGGAKDKFICENNHQNDVNVKFCTSENCGKNIKGLWKSEVEKIEEFKLKVEGLKILFNKI